MKGLQIEMARMARVAKVNFRHAQSLMSGRAAKRFKWLTENMLTGAMAAHGAQIVCRIVKEAVNEDEYYEAMRKAAA